MLYEKRTYATDGTIATRKLMYTSTIPTDSDTEIAFKTYDGTTSSYNIFTQPLYAGENRTIFTEDGTDLVAYAGTNIVLGVMDKDNDGDIDSADITAEKSDECKLTGLTITSSGETIDVSIKYNSKTLKATVPSLASVSLTYKGEYASVATDYNLATAGYTKPVTITCTAENSDTRTYTLVLTQEDA